MLQQERPVDTLINRLSDPNPSVRNNAALGLADLRANQAIDPLLEAIFKADNLGTNGTLVYALHQLDCSQKLKEIFAILFYQGYEAKLMAYQLLDQQVFEFTQEDILTVQTMWLDCLKHPAKCPDLDIADVRAMIEQAVAGYLSYLT